MLYQVLAYAGSLIVGLTLGAVLFRSRPVVKAVYYDSSGVSTNPPNVFELTAKKTLNFKIDEKHVLRIPQISAGEGLAALSRLSTLYGTLRKLIVDAEAIGLTPDAISIAALTNGIMLTIWNIAEPFNKKVVRKRFLKKGYADSAFLFQLTREIIDLWVKKKRQIALLEAMEPSRKTDGGPVYTVTLCSPEIGTITKLLSGSLLKWLNRKMKT